MLRPRSVVVVGASPNPSFVSSILKNLLTSGYDGRVAAVNPRYATILEAACSRYFVDDEQTLRFSELCQDLGDSLRAIDINPLIVRPVGQGLTAVDSLFELDPEPGLSPAGTRFAAI